jgi:hypothetical protein
MLQILEEGTFAEAVRRPQLFDPLGVIQLALFGIEEAAPANVLGGKKRL